ncbi:acyltransferase [Streptomyces spongiae]|uniref:Acyltransferase n=2 Tax=Streptomyces spongiae TaxID=565072 RepID=A0A5N8XHE0_9ACTN|nr:acyltransferase [Streptomyces spongiae]
MSMTGESATTPPGPPATASVPLPGRPGTALLTGPGASTADRSGRQARLPSLTVLRFPASLAVLVCHIYEFIWPERVWSGDLADDLLHHAAYLGVVLFFLLSGFVLTWAAREGDSARSFWRRRVVRVFPGHTVVWVIGAVLLLGSGGTLGVAAALELPLLHAWAFGPLVEFIVVSGVTWSLSCEVLFYLSFPLVVRLVRRLPRHRLAQCAALLCALVVAFPVVARALLPGTPLYGEFPVSRQQFWFVQVLPLTRFAEFLLGVILARMVAERVCPPQSGCRTPSWLSRRVWPSRSACPSCSRSPPRGSYR